MGGLACHPSITDGLWDRGDYLGAPLLHYLVVVGFHLARREGWSLCSQQGLRPSLLLALFTEAPRETV